MIDINLLRVDKGGNPDLVRESQRKRGASVELVDDAIALDKAWVKLRFDVDEYNKKWKLVSKLIGDKMKSAKQDGGSALKEDDPELVAWLKEKAQIEQEKALIEKEMLEKEALVHKKLTRIGNLVHDSVIVSSNEDNNEIVRYWWRGDREPVKGTGILSHDQVLTRLDGYDPERGAKVSGHRGYFLKNFGVRLNQALIQYGLDFLTKRNYTLLQTPFIMRRELMAKTAQLEEFDETLYKVVEGVADEEDKYLIATSEQPISAFHAGEWLLDETLPLRYGGVSTCFRKEAGAHGRDTWGIFRVHQFEKVEQFVLCAPEESWAFFDEMIGTSEAFYQSLGISYRIVSIVSGALNNAAAKKYDLEAWFPNYGQYKELVSCSNCTDYQSRPLEIRCGMKKMGDREKKYVHCLNATLTATERTLCCILENFQTPEGLVIPEVLRPYLGNIDFVPFVKSL